MKLEVHRVQRFLHVLNVNLRHRHPAVRVSQRRPQRADLLPRTKRSAQQAHRERRDISASEELSVRRETFAEPLATIMNRNS
jgi:hypothetical protein